MNIKILFQYHNNMYDTLLELQKHHNVTFLSYRVSKLTPGVTNKQPATLGRTLRIYRPISLWRLLANDTDLLLLKHLNDPINFVPLIIAAIRKIPTVIMVQRVSHPSFIGYKTLYRFLMFWLRRQNIKVLAVTKSGYDEAKRWNLKSWYIPACIDPSRFTEKTARANANFLNILTVSKYQDRKRLPELVKALSVLSKQYRSIKFTLTIIGSLSTRPASQKTYKLLNEEIKSSSMRGQISLLTNVPYKEMPAHYSQADLFIIPAASEPLGYAALEAMASGLPVLVSDEVGAASYISEGINGYVFSSNSDQAIIEAVKQFIKAGHIFHERIDEFGRASRHLTQALHSPAAFMRSFNNLSQ